MRHWHASAGLWSGSLDGLGTAAPGYSPRFTGPAWCRRAAQVLPRKGIGVPWPSTTAARLPPLP